MIGAGRYPDGIAVLCHKQGTLQQRIGIRPGTAILRTTLHIGIDENDFRLCSERGKH